MEFKANLFYARERYGTVPKFPATDGRFAKALMIIIGADGKISDAEMAAFLGAAELMGMPAGFREELRSFDFKNEKLEVHLKGLGDGPTSRRMLYDAIKIAHADGYAAEEHRMAQRAAELLGVEPSVVTAIEGLVATEIALMSARGALFTDA